MESNFDLGKMNASARLTATFRHYEIKEEYGDVVLYAYLTEGEVPKLNRGYGLDGRELWISLDNLYQKIRGKDDYSAATDIVAWCQQYAHPYYQSGNIAEYKWNMETDTDYWMFDTNILGSFYFKVSTMKKDLEKLYHDTHIIMMFKKCLEKIDFSSDLTQITWTSEYADFDKLSLNSQLIKIDDFLNKMNGFSMKLALDEYGELKIMPGFTSVFDAARFALAQYVSIPGDYPVYYGDKIGIGTCECCGSLFIKNGNRQKYCDNPECKKERNRRKSKTAYHRKLQEQLDDRWAWNTNSENKK